MVCYHKKNKKFLFLLLASSILRCSRSLQQPNPIIQTSHRETTTRRRESNIIPLSASSSSPKSKHRPLSFSAATAELGRVPYGESSRKYRRTIYNHDDWLRHRSNDKIFENLYSMFYSGVVRQIKKKIFLICGLSLSLVFWNDFLMPQYHESLPFLRLPTLPFSLSSPALALLLVFKTNTSYQRWLEGRNRWGVIVAQSTNVIRMAATFADSGSEKGKQTLDDLSFSVWILARTIMNRLAGPVEDEEEYKLQLREACEDDERLRLIAERVISSPERTAAALIQASLALDMIPVDEKRRVEIDKSFVILNDARIACDRIFSSPIPTVYTRHTARFLSLWMLMLPFAIHDEFLKADQWEFATVPAAGLLALFLFGIEELAVQLEEPFSILPMQVYCDEIREENRVMVEWSVTTKTTSTKIHNLAEK